MMMFTRGEFWRIREGEEKMRHEVLEKSRRSWRYLQ
jgi:hypothetical protein